jgi:hypothetical protein
MFTYGYGLTRDPRYQGMNWDAIEPLARQEWEARNANTWDQVKDGIHFAWSQARGGV